MRAPSHRHGGFDAWSATYDQSALQGVFFDRAHDALLRVLRPLLRGQAAPRVLDVGCGTGRLLVRLGKEFPGAELSGVDVTAGMIEVARGKPELSSVRLEVASASALPFGDASLDAALTTMSFHHWDDQAAGLRDVSRVLRPGAPLLLLDAYSVGPLAPLVRRWGRSHGSGMRSDGEVLSMLTAAGMVATELRRILVPLSPLGIMVARRS
jgi:ubiquinone/menaquinone biosynthesis C-methylase UbiE